MLTLVVVVEADDAEQKPNDELNSLPQDLLKFPPRHPCHPFFWGMTSGPFEEDLCVLWLSGWDCWDSISVCARLIEYNRVDRPSAFPAHP